MFVELAIIVSVATLMGFLAEKLKLPTLLGYLVAGIIISIWFQSGVGSHDLEMLLKDWGNIGVVFLLFLVGLEMSAPRVQNVGKAAFVVGMGQIVFTVSIGYVIAMLLGYSIVESMYVAVGLAFSSTVVIVKLLSEKSQLHTLHGRIAVGFLLVQDLAAIVMLVMISATSKGDLSLLLLVELLIKIVLVILIVWYLSTKIIPSLMIRISMSSEILFLSSVAWSLGLASLMVWEPIGFTLEAGGFLAGITLANTLQHYEIFARLRPLRDFFVMIFFVYLSIEMMSEWTGVNWLHVGIFSTFVLIGNPLIVMILMRFLKYRSKTGFLVSLSVAQISEFSLILVAMGVALGQVLSGTLRVMALVGVVTFGVSSVLIMNSDYLWRVMGKYLRKFEAKKVKNSVLVEEVFRDHLILIGCDRMGRIILENLATKEENLLIIDYNPEIVEKLQKEGFRAVLADAEDYEIFDMVNMKQSRGVISTVVNQCASLGLLEYLNVSRYKRGIVVLSASNYKDAVKLYDNGADYVNISRSIGGMHVIDVIYKAMFDKSSLKSKGVSELKVFSKLL